MEINGVTLRNVRCGEFYQDAALARRVPVAFLKKDPTVDDLGRERLGANSLLVQKGDYNILVFASMGGIHLSTGQKKYHGLVPGDGETEPSNRMIELPEALKPLGLTTSDISHVVMTHLEYDHANGLADPDGNPYCLNAEHLVRTWEFGGSQGDVPFQNFYNGKLLAGLKEKLGRKWIELTGTQTHQIIGELELRVSGGHTSHHQIVDGLGFCHLGDLMHDEHVLAPDQFNCYARNMVEVYRFKAQFLTKRTGPEGSNDVFFFNHGHRHHAGRIRKEVTPKGTRYSLEPVDLNADLEVA